MALLTDKVTLAQAGTALEWGFVPESVSTLEVARKQAANDSSLAWLAKGAAHRAVTPSVSGAISQLDGQLLLQRRIDPLLIDGRAWDLGVYVVFEQRPDGSLGTMIFDDVLLRFCTERHIPTADAQATMAAAATNATARRLAIESLRRSWVVGDEYTSAWQIHSLADSLHAQRNSPAPSLSALVEQLSPQRWERAYARIGEAIATTAAAAAAASDDARGTGRRIELVRYDFVLDGRGTPWLLEVNAWPNMVATSPGQAAQLQRLCSWLRRASSSSTPPITAAATSAPAALQRRLLPVLASAERSRRHLAHEGWHVVSSPLDSSAYELSRATSTVTVGSSSSFWSAIPSSPSSYSVTVGHKLSFRYNAGHNVWLMASAAKYASCDFTGATELASTSQGGGSGSSPNLYETVMTAAGTFHFACRVGSHCQMDQKVTITAAAAAASPSSPRAPPPLDADNDSSDSVDAVLIIGPVLGGVALLALAAAAALMCRGRATRASARATAPAAAPPASVKA